MSYTAAKSLVRNFFYQEFLPSQLSMQLLRGGNHLVLLGKGQEEVQLLAALGVPEHRIFSVENDPDIFRQQQIRKQRNELHASLYFGELTEFIMHRLHLNHRFQVLNLDICGSYLNGIDSQPPKEHRPNIPRNPTLMPVLLFARRNPRTVVATYTPVGRDRPQLREGLKSLAVCRWLAAESTEHVVHELYGRYRAAGLTQAVSFNLVLRHFFWIRSHLEHILLGRVAIGNVKPGSAQKFLDKLEWCWNQMSSQAAPPVHYRQWLDAADRLPLMGRQTKLLDLNLQAVTVVSYESDNGFYHTGWFTTYQSILPVTASEWLNMALKALITAPLRYTSAAAKSLKVYESAQESVPGDMVIWSKNDLNHPGRQLKVPAPAPQLFESGKVSTAEVPIVTLDSAAQNGDVRSMIRQLGREGRNTNEVLEMLPEARLLPRTSVTSLIAAARSKK